MIGNSELLLAALYSVRASSGTTDVKPLREALLAKVSEFFAVVSAGPIQSVSANGQSTVFQLGNLSSAPNANEMLKFWTRLVKLYDTCKAALATDDDDAIFVEMVAVLSDPITELYTTFEEVAR